jgi:hypothetical protein
MCDHCREFMVEGAQPNQAKLTGNIERPMIRPRLRALCVLIRCYELSRGNDRRDACVRIPCGRAAGVGLGSCLCVVQDRAPAGSRESGPRIAAVRAAERLTQACPSPAPTGRVRRSSRRVNSHAEGCPAAGSIWWCVMTRRPCSARGGMPPARLSPAIGPSWRLSLCLRPRSSAHRLTQRMAGHAMA